MKARPTSITVIAWILIVLSGISMIISVFSLRMQVTKDLMSRSPIPYNIQIVIMYAGLLVTIASAIGMLKGRNWARLLYVIWTLVGMAISFATSPMKASLIPGLLVFLVIAFFLFRPKANEFFRPSGDSENVPQAG